MGNANTNARAAVSRRKQSRGNGAQQQESGQDDFKTLLAKQKPEIGRALTGTALDPERFTRIALTVFRQSRGLQRCRPMTVLGSLMTAAQLGLEPGPLGEAWLVPYKDVCTFIIGYRGMIKLAWQSERLRHIDAQVVRENDDFDYAYGLEPFLRHKPARGDRGEVTDVYACASFHGGGGAFEVLSVEDVNALRDRSSAVKSGKESPWDTDWNQMARKTAIRQLSRFLPMSTGMSRALAADGSVRDSVAATVEDVAGSFADDDVVEGEVVNEEAEPEPTEPEQQPADEAADAQGGGA